MPVQPGRWANIIAIILQILGGLQPQPKATFATHKDAINAELINAGTVGDDLQKALLFVESHWTLLMQLWTDAQQAFGG